MAIELRQRVEDELVRHFGNRFQRFESGPTLVGAVSPESEEEVRRIMVLTSHPPLPIVPRAAATSAYGGSVPERGLVVRFDRLNRLLEIDGGRQEAVVQPGLVWDDLIYQLAPLGLMPRVYPSSKSFSTVGGFVAQGGVGIGSYQFGDVGRTVSAARIVDATGQPHTIVDEVGELVVGAEGRTGIIMEVSLRLQPKARLCAIAAFFDHTAEMQRALDGLGQLALPLWSVSIMDRTAVHLESRQRPRFALPLGRHAALFSFREPDRQVILPYLRGAVLGAGGGVLPLSDEGDEWLVHFMSLQTLGTTPIPMQFQIGVDRLAEFVARIGPRLRERLAFEAVVAQAAGSIAMRFFLVEHTLAPEENYAIARELLVAAKGVGGSAYSTGAFFAEEAATVFGAERLRALARFRRHADPHNRLNPGKAF